jgi:pyruvate dehydrogenase complex dehydrogenase (E1) component
MEYISDDEVKKAKELIVKAILGDGECDGKRARNE